jgi:hypothetical protein
MRFYALKEFRKEIGLEIEDPTHPDRVHKGAVVAIGGDRQFEELNEFQQRLVVGLRYLGYICDFDDDGRVEQLKWELYEDPNRSDQPRPGEPGTQTN